MFPSLKQAKISGFKCGRVAEWFKAHAWKACGRRKAPREFESLPLRQFFVAQLECPSLSLQNCPNPHKNQAVILKDKASLCMVSQPCARACFSVFGGKNGGKEIILVPKDLLGRGINIADLKNLRPVAVPA